MVIREKELNYHLKGVSLPSRSLSFQYLAHDKQPSSTCLT